MTLATNATENVIPTPPTSTTTTVIPGKTVTEVQTTEPVKPAGAVP